MVTSSHHTLIELQTVPKAHQLLTILQKAAHAHGFKISNCKWSERQLICNGKVIVTLEVHFNVGAFHNQSYRKDREPCTLPGSYTDLMEKQREKTVNKKGWLELVKCEGKDRGMGSLALCQMHSYKLKEGKINLPFYVNFREWARTTNLLHESVQKSSWE